MADSSGDPRYLQFGTSSTGDSGVDLERSLGEQARQRLRIVALLMIAVFIFAMVMHRLFDHLGWQHTFTPDRFAVAVDAVLCVFCGLVFMVAGWPRLHGCAVVKLGMVFQVAVGFGLALPFYVELSRWRCPGMTPLALWLVFYPLVVPSPPMRSLTVSLITASMPPLVYLLGRARGIEPASLEILVKAYVPNYLAVAIAIFPILVVYRMGRRVHHADRELRQLGAYTLRERIGSGGMGEVWLAGHRLLARPAAVKLVRPAALARGSDEDTAATMARFQREARITADLESPHTVQLYDVGTDEDGNLYYVMELLRGLDGETLVERFGPLGGGRVVYLLRQACLSLAEAHQRDLVHRDIKPANLFVCRLGLDCDFVKILDFGLAVCHRCHGPAADPRLTGDSLVIGTPAFMAPEMAIGDGPVDGRADLYALGCVAYYLLTGTYVFSEPSGMLMLSAQIRERPAPPSSRIDKPLCADLEAVVMDCLAKDPDDRPPSALDLARRLEACACAGRWDQHQARGWWQRHMAEYLVGEGV